MREISSSAAQGAPSLGFTPPPLPQSVSYHDEYEDVAYTIRGLDSHQWSVSCYGTKRTIDFSHLSSVPDLQQIVKLTLAEALSEWAPVSVVDTFNALQATGTAELAELISATPRQAMVFWESRVRDRWSIKACLAAKTLLRLLCARWLGPWTPQHTDFVVTAFPNPKRDKYVSVRDGSVFLDVSEEAALVRWLDEQVVRADALTVDEARNACMVACCFQLGMRPLQLGLLQRSDVVIRPRIGSGEFFVYLRFRKIKQSRKKARREIDPRSLTTAWTPLFMRFFTLTQMREEYGRALFGFASASDLLAELNASIKSVLGEARTAYSLRHTAAQRMADAGASIEEVAEFLGHSTLTTSLVYFGASANQAERVNSALGISDTYATVRRIAEDRFISEKELRQLKGKHQIAGVPHGIPIAGIGKCEKGQPDCPFNPVMACYDCPSNAFMPVRNVAIHRGVLGDLRSIVVTFSEASRGDMHSPAFMQLRRTIRGCQSVIATLTGPGFDSESTS